MPSSLSSVTLRFQNFGCFRLPQARFVTIDLGQFIPTSSAYITFNYKRYFKGRVPTTRPFHAHLPTGYYSVYFTIPHCERYPQEFVVSAPLARTVTLAPGYLLKPHEIMMVDFWPSAGLVVKVPTVIRRVKVVGAGGNLAEGIHFGTTWLFDDVPSGSGRIILYARTGRSWIYPQNFPRDGFVNASYSEADVDRWAYAIP